MPSKKTAPNGLNLDDLEREGDVIEAYVFTLAGRQWTTKQPEEIDWKIAYGLDPDNPYEVLSAYLDEEQYLEFVKVPLPSWKAKILFAALEEHYRPAVEAEGEDKGLPTS